MGGGRPTLHSVMYLEGIAIGVTAVMAALGMVRAAMVVRLTLFRIPGMPGRLVVCGCACMGVWVYGKCEVCGYGWLCVSGVGGGGYGYGYGYGKPTSAISHFSLHSV